jgi:choline dehydrogenase-like flavoprotein
MILDLAAQPSKQERRAKIVIVGAGVAGLFLAARLRSKNIRVIVLESGAEEQQSDTHPLNEVVQIGLGYAGASKGRFRCLGGTSTRWGGALIPFSPEDLLRRDYLDAPGFPIGFEELSPYLREVEEIFGLDPASYNDDYLAESGVKYVPSSDPNFLTRFAKWPPFGKRNVAALFRPMIKRDPDAEVWINATVTNFGVSAESGSISSVTASYEGEKTITVYADYFVICAGAIETTRLMLLFNKLYHGRIFQGCNALGLYLHDHISRRVANIRASRVDQLNRMAGFRFVGRAMRSLRFELSPRAQREEVVGSAFGHISFATDEVTGFDVLRQFLRSAQQKGRFDPRSALALLKQAPYLSRLAAWRLGHKQLLWPSPARYELHAVAEQLPQASNKIALSSKGDRFGLPLAEITWRVATEDLKTFDVFRRRFDRFWSSKGLSEIGVLEWLKSSADDSVEASLASDVFHPGGTTRMGTTSEDAVVDADLRCFHVRNMWLASTSVFPTGGGENPTLMLILFTMRLADHLNDRIRAG